jgi:WD40 repeat protein
MSATPAAPGPKTPDPPVPQVDERYRCGNLTYTKASLAALFGWLIWGDICFNLFETQGGYTILNLYLQDNFHVSNLTVNILFNVIPMLIGTVMTPIISFKSDRTRTRMGRRIPYILFTAPFLAAFAAAIGFSDDIVGYCKAVVPETALVNPFTVALGVIGFVTIGYSFFNEFVGTVYYYLLPDVMPRHFIGRFQGVGRMVGTGSGIAVNLFIVPYQLTHLKAIHVGLAILYIVGLGLVCMFVKEGKYPAVEDVGEQTKFTDQVRLYFRECFTHPIFVLFYIATACTVLTRGLNPAGIFHLHLAEHQAKAVAYVQAPDAEAPSTAPAATDADTTAALLMAMTPDGKRVVCGDRDGEVSVWKMASDTPSLVKTIKTQEGAISAVAVAPDDKTVVCAFRAGTIEVLDIASGKSLHQLQAHAGGVRGVAVSPDGTRLASAGADKTVRIWDLASGKCLHTLTGHDGDVNCVAFSSDGGRVVSGGADGKIIIWDARTGGLIKTLEGSPGPVYTVCFAPALGPVPAHELPARNWVMTEVHEAAFFLEQVFTNESLYDVPAEQTSKVLAPDGWVISGGRDGARDDENSRVRIWDVAEGKQVRDLIGHKQAISCVVYKPDLRVILSGSPDGSIRVWQPWAISDAPGITDQSYKTMSGYTRGVTSMAAAAAGTTLINASADGTLHTWDIDQGVSLAKGGLKGVFFSIVTLLLAYPIGAMVDRWNPIRIFLWCSFAALPFTVLYFFWYHSYVFGLYVDLIRLPVNMLSAMATVPMLIVLYPKSKYGQFCSANALVRQAVAAIAGPLGAVLMDFLTTRALDTDYFRYGYLFQFVAYGLSFVAMLGVYYYWKKLGGDNYTAPEAAPAEAPAAAAPAATGE